MQNITVLKAPREEMSGFSPVNLISYFKYEIIKVLIFLLLFAASLMYVNSQSKLYYYKQVSANKEYSTEKNN